MSKTVSIGDIQLGTLVKVSQLANIKGIYFLIKDPVKVLDTNGFLSETQGTLVYANPEQTDDYYNLLESGQNILILYNREGDYFEY